MPGAPAAAPVADAPPRSRLRAAFRVVLGRGAARACIQLSLLALLPVWGADRFGAYAAATGAFVWLVPAVLGVEKAALTAVPRARVLADQVIRSLVARAAVPFAVALVVALVLAPVGGWPGLYSAAAAYSAGMGLLSVLAAVHRLAGRSGRDTAGFVGYALWTLAMAGLAALGYLQPNGYLLALVAGLAVDTAILAFLAPALRGKRSGGRRLGRLLNRRVALLGFSDVADNLAISVLYIVLAAVADPAESALVYLMLMVSSLLGSLGVLVLRLAQPVASMRLRGTGGEGGRALARRLTGWVACLAGGFAVAAFVAVLAGRIAAGADLLGSVGNHPLAIGGVVLVEMTLFCGVLYAVFLLENTNGAALSLTSSAAVASLVTASALAVPAVAGLGAVGAFLALIAGLAAKSTVIHFGLRGHLGGIGIARTA